MLMFSKDTTIKKKKSQSSQNTIKKAMGIYSSGFIITTDVIAYFLKRTLLILHEFMPVVLLHKGVDILQDTRDSIGKGLSEFAYCTNCTGSGIIYTNSPEGKMVVDTCPSCNGTGKYSSNLVRDRSKEKLKLKKDHTEILTLFEEHIKRLLIEAKGEQERKHLACILCAGEGTFEATDGKKETCEVCQGTGKDYNRLVQVLRVKFVQDLKEAGYSQEEAEVKFKDVYPKAEDKTELMARLG